MLSTRPIKPFLSKTRCQNIGVICIVTSDKTFSFYFYIPFELLGPKHTYRPQRYIHSMKGPWSFKSSLAKIQLLVYVHFEPRLRYVS